MTDDEIEEVVPGDLDFDGMEEDGGTFDLVADVKAALKEDRKPRLVVDNTTPKPAG